MTCEALFFKHVGDYIPVFKKGKMIRSGNYNLKSFLYGSLTLSNIIEYHGPRYIYAKVKINEYIRSIYDFYVFTDKMIVVELLHGTYVDRGETFHFANGLLHNPYGPAISRGNNVCWFLNGLLHRQDGPAIENINGREWWINGVPHREDEPAISNNMRGFVAYIIGGKHHRTNGPAVDWNNGEYEWWENGVKHRVGRPACKYRLSEEWWFQGRLHRTDGPAVMGDYVKKWYFHGKLHREYGPAYRNFYESKWYSHGMLHRADGPAYVCDAFREWWFEDNKVTQEIIEKIIFFRRNRAAKVIQRGCIPWIDKPKTNDGKLGISVRIGLRKCFEYTSMFF